MNIGNGDQLPSEFKDPFDKKCIERISTASYKSLFDDNKISHTGRIQFKNGDTEGEQSFKADSFEALLAKMNEFMKQL